MTNTDERTYAEAWADPINETYPDSEDDRDNLAWSFATDVLCKGRGHQEPGTVVNFTREEVDDCISRVLTKAADALRYGRPATFTHSELDMVRHLMPAHEVLQSGSVRFVTEIYGYHRDGYRNSEEFKAWSESIKAKAAAESR